MTYFIGKGKKKMTTTPWPYPVQNNLKDAIRSMLAIVTLAACVLLGMASVNGYRFSASRNVYGEPAVFLAGPIPTSQNVEMDRCNTLVGWGKYQFGYTLRLVDGRINDAVIYVTSHGC